MSRFTPRSHALDTLLWLAAGVVALLLIPLLWLAQAVEARAASIRRSPGA